MRDEQLLVPFLNCTIGQSRARRDAGTAATRGRRRFFPTNARRRQREGTGTSCSYYGGEETLIVAHSGSRFGPQQPTAMFPRPPRI